MPEKWRRLESLRCSGWKPLPLWVATLREGHTLRPLQLKNGPHRHWREPKKHFGEMIKLRLIKDMAFNGIAEIESGNAWLRKRFLNNLNRKFAIKLLSELDFHQPLPIGINLAEVFVWEDQRKVQDDGTIRWENRWFQLFKGEGNFQLVIANAPNKTVISARPWMILLTSPYETLFVSIRHHSISLWWIFALAKNRAL